MLLFRKRRDFRTPTNLFIWNIACPSLVMCTIGETGDLNLVKIVLTSHPKASNGQQFPCPALLFLVFLGGKQGSSPDRGQSPQEWGDYISCVRVGGRTDKSQITIWRGFALREWNNRPTNRWTDRLTVTYIVVCT